MHISFKADAAEIVRFLDQVIYLAEREMLKRQYLAEKAKLKEACIDPDSIDTLENETA